MMTRAVLPSRAARSWAEFSSIFTIVPGVCSKPDTVACSCRSRTTRSVMTMTLSKTLVSDSSCRLARRWQIQAMVFDLPEPAECWTR